MNVYNGREFKHIISNTAYYLPPCQNTRHLNIVIEYREVSLFYKLGIPYNQNLGNSLFILSFLKVMQPTIIGNKTE